MSFANRTALSCSGALVVLATLLVLTGCGSSHSSYEAHMTRGKQYLAAGNLDKASVEFRNALQIEPRNGAAFYFNGRVAERRGNLREAAGFYQAAVDARPDDTLARASLGKVFVLAGATQQALDVISPGLLEHPDDPDLLAARAAVRHQLNDDVDARRDAERAVRAVPTNENAIAVLAALALRAGDRARAVSVVTEAITRAPDSIDLRRILASIYLSIGQPDKAEEQMRTIIALEPTEIGPRVQLANHLTQGHKLDEAQQVLEEAVRALPHRDQPKLILIDFISTQRSREAGVKALQGFIAREPDNEDLRLALGTLLQRTGATHEAIATYREIIRREGIRPRGLAARDRLAAIEIAAGHENEARALIEEVLDQSPRDDDALIMRANLALTHNDPTDAIVDLRPVVRNQPRSVVLQRLLARAYMAKGEPAMAEGALRAAVDAAPDDASLKIELAQFLAQTERPTQAVTLLEEAVRKLPGEPKLRAALIRAYMANRDLAGAQTAAEELQKLRPAEAEGYYLAGLVAHAQSHTDEAARSFERACELQPDSIEILTSVTQFDLERGRAPTAVARLQHSLEREPRSVPVLNLLGGAYLESKDYAHATEVFTRAVELDPTSWVAYRGLAQVRLAAGDTNGAIEQYRAAMKVAAAEPRVVTELAGLYEKQGRVDEAIAYYEALYQSSGKGQLAANNLAMLLATYRSDPASLARAQALTTGFEGADNPSFLDTLGWVRFKRHEYREAVIVLERASDRAPDSKVIRFHLGMAELKLGERDRARSNLESALSGSGNFTGSEEARAALATLKNARSG